VYWIASTVAVAAVRTMDRERVCVQGSISMTLVGRAPNRSGETPQVMVSRLLPVGNVIYDVGDELRLRERQPGTSARPSFNRRSRVSTGSRAMVRTRFAAPATRPASRSLASSRHTTALKTRRRRNG
jgi:hypothetical protein